MSPSSAETVDHPVCRRAVRSFSAWFAGLVTLSGAFIIGCETGAGFPLPDGDGFPLAVSVISPGELTVLRSGETVRIRWIDTGVQAGATVTLKVIFTDDNGVETRETILAKRDALSDGDADTFDWNGTNISGRALAARRYQVEATLVNPDGKGDARIGEGEIVIPFNFVGAGPADMNAELRNHGGLGPFELIDAESDFVDAGIRAGDTLHVEGGSGSKTGTYRIISVNRTTLRLASDAGDSDGDTNVRYLVEASAAVLRDTEDLITIAWRDEGMGTAASIDLEVDLDQDESNDNANPIRENVNLGPDEANDRFAWDGTDTSGSRVRPGKYFVRATISPVGETPFSYMLPDRISLGGVAPSIQLTQPSTARNPAAGAEVTIRWTDSDPDDDAQITLLADPDSDEDDPGHDSGNELVIKSGIDEDDPEDSFPWVTAGFPEGSYTVVGRIEDADGQTAMSSAPGPVTLQDSPPVLRWIRPEGVAADTSNNNGLGPFRLTDTSAAFSTSSLRVRDLVFSGNSAKITEGTGVAAGEYVVKSDPVSPTELVLETDPGGSGGSGDVEYRVTGDIHLIRGSSPLFDFKTHDPEQSDASFDLFLDFDDLDDNGNEFPILINRVIPFGVVAQNDSFSWTNTRDAENKPILPAGYRLYAELNDGVPRSPFPRAAFEGLVFLRPGLNEPQITLTFPDQDFSPNDNQKVPIRWDDENTDANTTITLRYDDDPYPGEATETDEPEKTIRAGIAANPDPSSPGAGGNPDEWQWDWHPSDITKPAVPEGDYSLFGYIGNNGDPLVNPDFVSVLPFLATIRNLPPELRFTIPGSGGGEFPSPDGANIVWNQRDADEDPVRINLWLDPDDNFAENNNQEIQIATDAQVQALASVSPFPWGGPDRSFPWDGMDRFGEPVETGAYRLVAVIDDGVNDSRTVPASGLVRFRPDVNTAVILLASQFVESTVGVEGQVNISYRVIPVTGTEEVELYLDDERDPGDDLGTLISSNRPATANMLHTFLWDLSEMNPPVSPGTYYLHARLMDGAVQKAVSTSKATLEVTAEGVTPSLDILFPTAVGVDVVRGMDSVNIAWDYTSGQTGTLTLRADPDNNATNNNEILILSNRVLDPAPDGASDSFNWGLTDTQGADVPTGAYLIRGRFAVIDALSRTAPGTARIRKSDFAPLVRVTQPTNNISYTEDQPPNRDILIRWEVDDLPPNTTVKVDIWFDRNPSAESSAGVLSDGEPLGGLAGLGTTAGIIVEDLNASQGLYDWLTQNQPAFLTNVDATWYIHIRIRDGALPADDDRDTAVGTIRVN